MPSSGIDTLKQQAAEAAVSEIEDGMVVGLGTGSTVRYALASMADSIRSGRLANMLGIPSSIRTEQLARSLGIPLTTFKDHPHIDITIDGADEVDPNLNLIKGAGGALLREKILAQASRVTLIAVDGGKLSPRLGTRRKLPIEVFPFGLDVEMAYLKATGTAVTLRCNADGDPCRSDQGNYLLDVDVGPIADPYQLQARLDARAGVAAHGLFLDLAQRIFAGTADGLQIMTRETSGGRRQPLSPGARPDSTPECGHHDRHR